MLGSVEASNGEGSTEINDKEKTETDHPGETCCDATPRYENIETEETELQMGVLEEPSEDKASEDCCNEGTNCTTGPDEVDGLPRDSNIESQEGLG